MCKTLKGLLQENDRKNLLFLFLVLIVTMLPSIPVQAINNPANLSVSCTYGRLSASWSSVAGATYYPVRLSKANDNSNLIVSIDPYSSTSYSLNGSPLAVGGYDFWVHALDTVNNVWSSGIAVKNVQCTSPPAPTGLTASCANGTVTARWNSVSGIDSYAARLDYKKDVAGNSTNNKSGCTETDAWYCGSPDVLTDAYASTSFSKSGLPDGTYDFWVQTYVSTLPHPTNWSAVTKISNIVCATDNGCAANTCTTSTCNNGITTVQGTKVCADNSCAATTCNTTTCWNNLTWINGTKVCADNSCAANTCTTGTCFNNLAWISGTKTCTDNGCAANTCTGSTCDNGSAIVSGTKTCTDNGCAARTCQVSNSGMQTSCDNSFATVPGTLQSIFTTKCIQPAALPVSAIRCDSSAAGNCGKTITTQDAGSCSIIDSSGCMNSTTCSSDELTACQQQYPAVTKTCPTCKGIVIEVRP